MRRLGTDKHMEIMKQGNHVPDGVERVRRKASTNGDTPAEEEGGEEGALEGADENDGL